MSYPTWPSELSYFVRSDWSAQRQDARRKRANEAGPPGYRRRSSAVSKTVALAIVVDRNGKDIFDEFYRVECAEGSSPFWMPDPATDGWPLLDSNGQPLLDGQGHPLLRSGTWLCLWGDQIPAETIVEQVKFKFSFSVVVMP